MPFDNAAAARDAEFFSAHAWCLNPALTIHDLRIRLEQSWRLLGASTVAWQQQECRVNLYLLLCALDCSSGDYLCHRSWRLDVLSRRLPRLRPAIGAVQALLNLPDTLRRAGERSAVRRWRQPLEQGVNAVCRALAARAAGAAEDWSVLAEGLPGLLSTPLPQSALRWRMRIPEAFRCQDMTHHDVIAMAQRFAAAPGTPTDGPVFVLGPRTAGAYFVPLVHAVLERSGIRTAGWMTLRPKEGLTRAERRRLRAACAGAMRLLIVDDHPNTGHTFTLIVALLRGLGAPLNSMTILAPDHPAQTDWTPLVHPVPVIALAHADFYKSRLLRDEGRLAQLLRETLGERPGATLQVRENTALDPINAALTAHYADGFQARLKRVFEIEWSSPGAAPVRQMVLAKSVGWGWLAYHAHLTAARLHDFVPPLLGLREGVMFLAWSGGPRWPAAAPAAEAIAALVPGYVAARVAAVPLAEDPVTGTVGYRQAGRARLLEILRRPYGRLAGYLVRAELDRRLGALAAPVPTLVDGRMNLENWVDGPVHALKVDFEHHNFGGGEQDIVDPAFDLAGAIFALNLEPDAERRLVDAYAAASGDTGVRDRLLLYKLHLGVLAVDAAIYTLRRPRHGGRLREANQRYVAGQNFLTFHCNRHSASRIPFAATAAWTPSVVALDLDGVFDTWSFYVFPNTTTAGLRAVRLLQANGYSVMPNTARSAEHVLEYCKSYGLPGGIAELGCVFVDRVGGREHFLFEPALAGELARCRAFVEARPGLATDPGYKAAVRAYRYLDGELSGLSPDEAREILRSGGFTGLDVVTSAAATFFVPRGCDKGTALAAVKAMLLPAPQFVVAIGDSDLDVGMLQLADLAYVPANGSPALRALIRGLPHIHVMGQPCQRGLLEAVEHLLRRSGGAVGRAAAQPITALPPPSDHIFDAAIEAGGWPPWRRWITAVSVLAGATARRRPATR